MHGEGLPQLRYVAYPTAQGPSGAFGAAGRWTVPGAAHLPCPQNERRTLQLRGRISELEAELAEQRHLKQQALDESEFLRTELEELKKQREDTEKAQRSLTEIERE